MIKCVSAQFKSNTTLQRSATTLKALGDFKQGSAWEKFFNTDHDRQVSEHTALQLAVYGAV